MLYLLEFEKVDMLRFFLVKNYPWSIGQVFRKVSVKNISELAHGGDCRLDFVFQ